MNTPRTPAPATTTSGCWLNGPPRSGRAARSCQAPSSEGSAARADRLSSRRLRRAPPCSVPHGTPPPAAPPAGANVPSALVVDPDVADHGEAAYLGCDVDQHTIALLRRRHPELLELTRRRHLGIVDCAMADVHANLASRACFGAADRLDDPSVIHLVQKVRKLHVEARAYQLPEAPPPPKPPPPPENPPPLEPPPQPPAPATSRRPSPRPAILRADTSDSRRQCRVSVPSAPGAGRAAPRALR